MVKTIIMDMTEGPILKKLFVFALPIIAMNILQVLFNAVDVAVVGIFEDDNSVAAVGTNGPIINLLISLFVGMSLATNILLSKFIGAKDDERAGKVVGTSIYLSIVAGFVLAVLGFFLTKPLLIITGCLPEILDLASLYLKIYFMGMPFIMLYNFSASVLRASGDTFHPMLFIVIAGLINVFGNLFMVGVLNFGVAGVAIATVASQAFSALASLVVIVKQDGPSKLRKKYFKFYKKELKEIIFLGVPSGVQSSLFSISNLVVLSAINSFGATFVASYAIVNNFESIMFQLGESIGVASLSFMSQNYGAKNLPRIKRTVFCALALILLLDLLVGLIIIFISPSICAVMTNSTEVINFALERIRFMTPLYFFCASMSVTGNVLKSFGKTTTSMVIALIFTCLFRIVYIKTVLNAYKSVITLYILYPLSWIITAIVYVFVGIVIYKKIQKKFLSTDSFTEEMI